MKHRVFHTLLANQWARGNFVCVGLDSEFSKIPKSAHIGVHGLAVNVANTIVEFNRQIVETTKDLVCAYKLNSAFYEAFGAEGVEALQRSINDIHNIAPDVPVILDAKRADIGNTNMGYATAAFDVLRADAITVHPYLGAEAMQPFLARAEKGIIVLCRTSNPGSDEFQDLTMITADPLYKRVAHNVSKTWNKNGNCSLVVGATYPDELREVRGIIGDMPILIPGIGAQGGDVEKTVIAGQSSNGQGMIINSSRGIIFASNGADFAEAARRETIKLRDTINQYRQTA